VWGFFFSWLYRGNRGRCNRVVHLMELGVLVETVGVMSRRFGPLRLLFFGTVGVFHVESSTEPWSLSGVLGLVYLHRGDS
jgi:hypothetical protein